MFEHLIEFIYFRSSLSPPNQFWRNRIVTGVSAFKPAVTIIAIGYYPSLLKQSHGVI
jgi:hypothetical protein